MNKTTLVITQAGTLAVVIGTIAAEDALQLKTLRELGPDETVNIARLSEFAISESADTMQAIEKWRGAHPKLG